MTLGKSLDPTDPCPRGTTLLFCSLGAALASLSLIPWVEEGFHIQDEEVACGNESQKKQTAQDGPQTWSGADAVGPSLGI